MRASVPRKFPAEVIIHIKEVRTRNFFVLFASPVKNPFFSGSKNESEIRAEITMTEITVLAISKITLASYLN
jgi:hypothetical protein